MDARGSKYWLEIMLLGGWESDIRLPQPSSSTMYGHSLAIHCTSKHKEREAGEGPGS